MKRKLVQQGAATMMISLPAKWIKKFNLKKGDEIELLEKNDNLVVGTELKEKKQITIKITKENKKDIKNILTHTYRKGFDKIILENHKGLLKEIKSLISDLLLGFELTEMNKDRITIENISEPTSQKYDMILRKIFDIIQDTANITAEDFENNQLKNFEDINDLKKQQERFILFCRRLLAKGNTGKNTVLHWELLTFLLHIEHRYNYLYKFASKNKPTKNKVIISLLKNTKDYFDLYKEAYYKKDINIIHKINELKKEYYLGKCINALKKSKGNDTVILTYIREIFRIIQIGTSPILVESFN